MIYLNNAATTWPKPEIVYETVDDCFRNLNSPDRTSSEEGERSTATMQNCRAEAAEFFNIQDSSRLAFMPSCTYALNLAILGQQWYEDDIIIISGLEHHAVSRPVRKLAHERGVEFLVSPYRPDQPFDLQFLEDSLRRGCVKLVATTLASNVSGDILPVEEIGKLCRQYDARLLVDAAQAAGVLPVDVERLECDFMAFAGHKGLYAPPGVGGLFVREGIVLKTMAEGGTGKDSGKHEMSGSFPSTFEVGTHNLMAIVGLTAGLRWVKQAGMDSIHNHEQALVARFLNGLEQIDGVTVYGNPDPQQRVALVSLNLDGTSPQDVSDWLAENHNVATRAGYHCAPLPHETLGTLPGPGTIRFSFSFSNTEEEVDAVLGMLAEVPRLAKV